MDTSAGRLLVVAAVRQELSPFSRQVNGRNVDLLFTGMGPTRAREAVSRYLIRQKPSALVVSGFSGAMRGGLRLGDLVAATYVVDSVSGKRFTAPLRPEGKGIAKAGCFLTSPRLLSVSEKIQLGFKYSAVAVDMETASVAEVAEGFQVPWAALRVILDPVEVELPMASLQQVLRWLTWPGRWGEWIDWIKAVRLASRSLSDGLHQWMKEQEENDGFGKNRKSH